MLVRLTLLLLLLGIPSANADAQHFARRASAAACRCDPPGKPRKRRFLLPIAGGIGILPVSIAARDSQTPMLALPSLIDIRDNTAPRNALEGERALEVGALAPDTATSLPTIMLIAGALVSLGAYLMLPRRRKRAVAAAWRTRFVLGARGGWRLRTIHRRRLGGGFAAAGGLLLLLGSREYAEGAQAQRRARAEWIQMGSKVIRVNEDPADARATGAAAAPAPTTDTTSARPTASARSSVVPLPVFATSGREIRLGTPVARLVISSIGLDEIVTEGVGPVELNGGPGHFPGSVLPGDAGNSILSAHRDRHFSRVGELVVGSKIRTETRDQTVEWVVTERRIVSKDTPALFEESEATLTLTTCWPLRYFGPAPDRLLIIAKPVQ